MMNISHAARRIILLRLRFAADIFLVVAIGSFAIIAIAHRLLPLTHRIGSEFASHNRVQTGGGNLNPADRPSYEANVRDVLFQNLQADNSRLEMLEEQRRRLSRHLLGAGHSIQFDHRESHAIPAERNVREQLVSALVRLLKLERQDAEDDPEIIAARDQVTRLQADVTRSAADAQSLPPVQRAEQSADQVRLDKVNAEISRCGNAIVSDIQRLSQVNTQARQAATAGSADKFGSAPSTSNRSSSEKPSRTSGTSMNTRLSFVTIGLWISRLSNRSILVISIALGVVFSTFAVIFADRFDRSIHNEEQVPERK